MSFKATVDMFVNFSYIQVRFLNRQGYLRYRIKIYMKLEGKQVSCHPYNIVKGPTKNAQSFPIQKGQNIDSEIDGDVLCYYSRLIPVRYRAGSYEQNQTVFFKAYVNTDAIQDIEFYCRIECLFTEDINQKLQVLGKFQARIRKIYQISTFLPVVFDAFQGFMIYSTFHSTILQFSFREDDFESLKTKKIIQMQKKYSNFYQFISFLTNKFNRQDLLRFYEYYRNFLQKQHEVIQRRHNDLIDKLINEGKVKSTEDLKSNQVSNVKILKNSQLLKMIMGKSLYEGSKQISALSEQQKQNIVDWIGKDFATMKSFVYKKWMQFVNFVINRSKNIAKFYRKQYQMLCKQRFKNNVFSHKIKNHDWRFAKYNDSGKINIQQAFSQKKKSVCQEQLWNEQFPIESLSYFGKTETHVKMFEQIYVTKALKNDEMETKYSKLKHIIVLVHGFQASRQDFILLKNCLQIVYGIQVIISTCNEGLTQNSINLAGKRLATELKKVLANYYHEYRLSFVGHSMGGLIIRSAIPQLTQFADKFYTYMSFSTPHLGYLYQSSTLIKAGLWILTAWQKIQALQEIAMNDKSNLRETVLYNLTKNGSLNKFKKICFVCSALDEYVVYESARVQLNEKLMKETLDQNTQNVMKEMVDGILGQITAKQISRINVIFNIQDKNLDSFLGRTGHIKFLSDIQFIREFCSCFDKFFA